MEDPFLLPKNVIARLQDKKILAAAMNEGEQGQDIFGFSDDDMRVMYEKAYHYLEEQKISEGIDSFIFLTTISPGHFEYWMGFGTALQLSHEYEKAIDAYEVAAICNMENPVPYIFLGKCLFAIHDRKSAYQAFELALLYAGDLEEFAEIRREAENALQHIKEMES